MLVAACSSTVDINVDDSTRFSQFAGSIPLGGKSSNRLRLRWAEVDGESDQRLNDGQFIRTGDTVIAGPTVVEVEADLTYYSVAIGSEVETGNNLKSIIYYGISQTEFEYTLAESGTRVSRNSDTTEFYFQLAVAGEIAESLELGLSGAFSIGREFSGISEIDLTLDYELMSSLVLSGGYRWFDYRYSTAGTDSDLEVDFNGPFIGLYLPF